MTVNTSCHAGWAEKYIRKRDWLASEPMVDASPAPSAFQALVTIRPAQTGFRLVPRRQCDIPCRLLITDTLRGPVRSRLVGPGTGNPAGSPQTSPPPHHPGLAREACTLGLRQFTSRCRSRSLLLFSVRRARIETFARELEALGRARETVTRRLCTIAGFYRYAVEEELLDHYPAAHVRRPRLDYKSHATALDRNELDARGSKHHSLSPWQSPRIPRGPGAVTNDLRASQRSSWLAWPVKIIGNSAARFCSRYVNHSSSRAERGRYSCPADGRAYSTKSSWLITCTPSARRALSRSSTQTGHQYHHCGRRARGMSRGRPGARVCGDVALALDVGQALGELAISDPDNIHATHVPVRPVVAPAHDGAS